MRRFDHKDELRSLAAERKRRHDSTAPCGEGVPQIAERLAVMFPALPQDTVEAVLSQLFHADAGCTREQLADRAVSMLMEMSFSDGTPQAITSFEPMSIIADDVAVIDEASSSAGFRVSDSGATAKVSATPSGTAPSFSTAVAWDDCQDELLDAQLALLLSLPDDALLPCARTLASILDRIAKEPNNERIRRLRFANDKFATTVGRHEAAVDLLRLAGFEDDGAGLEDGADRALSFGGDPEAASSLPFRRVREALRGIVEDLGDQAPAAAVPTRKPCDDGRRQRIAELTEQRLKDPRQFRQQAQARGAANRHDGGGRIRRPTAPPAVPDRRSKHFTLADIEKMRITEDIANMPSYAEEYRLARQSEPAHDYGTLVSRSYDPELISRQALDGTNRYRASKGLSPLRWHDGIARIAAQHAAQMASGAATFSHDGFNARVAAFPVPQRAAAENLALNSGVADVAGTAVKGWIESPGHERNLRGSYNLCGIGTARASNGTFYLTQLFALAY